MSIRLHVGDELEHDASPLIGRLCEERFASRLLARDASLWGVEAQQEASHRLGWVDPFEASAHVLDEAIRLRDALRSRGVDRVVLCGMGGSSLGPEVVAREAGAALSVLDSTHPDEVRRALDCDLSRTAVVVSSKSGSTLETLIHSQLFRRAFLASGIDPVERIVYVTDPGSQLEKHADEGYRVFLADPDVGGRFSVLTAFGIVPTVLSGADTRRVLDEARLVHEQLFADSPDNPALRLAAAIAAPLPSRFALLLSEADDARLGLGDWIEQLIAESTGKEGKGVLPISLPVDAPELSALPANAILAGLGSELCGPHGIAVRAPLGAQLLLWEVATAALGGLIGINPFDQPDVEAAKTAAREVLGGSDGAQPPLEPLPGEQQLIAELSAAVPEGGYLAIQAFLDRQSPAADSARRLRNRLAEALRVPVSLGWGPRYLHSTGQFHKGGPALGAFLQLVAPEGGDFEIPGEPNGFGALMRAQARGDREVLEQRGRRVVTRAL